MIHDAPTGTVIYRSNRARGGRAKKAFPQAGVTPPSPGEEPVTGFAARARAAWAPIATERSPPLGLANWPRYANLPLTYPSVSDIA
jgi:hypothetical protein